MALSTGLSLAKTLVFKIMRTAPQAQGIWRGGLWRYAGSIAPVRQISLFERCKSCAYVGLLVIACKQQQH